MRNFPSLPLSKYINLDQNNISDQELQYLKHLPQLEYLSLKNNNIKKIDCFGDLQNLKKLKVIIIQGNPIQYEDKYREKLFVLLPQLKYIDFFSKDQDLLDIELNPFDINFK